MPDVHTWARGEKLKRGGGFIPRKLASPKSLVCCWNYFISRKTIISKRFIPYIITERNKSKTCANVSVFGEKTIEYCLFSLVR